ncbi:NifU family protein [Nocardioides sp.]|uniref:NifU family protein n=1 Tax=Nocardioides sp. TaxID=35761 RepID=UPI003526D376
MTATADRAAERAARGAAHPSSADALDETARRLDETEDAVAGLDGAAREVATAAIEARDEVHREVLTTIVRRLKEDPRGKELLFELVDDPQLRLVLMMHGILRPDPMTLAARVIEQVRPNLQSHGGDVELVDVRDATAYVRLQGACNGCSMAAVTLRDGVEEALVAGVPGISAVEVVPNEPSPTLIPLSSIGVGAPSSGEDLAASGWTDACAVDRVADGSLQPLTLVTDQGSLEVIVVNLGGRLSAYLNACAHQGNPLDDALVDATEGTLTCPWHGFCYDVASGECLTMPGAQLEPLPLRVEGGRVWVRRSGTLAVGPGA